MTHSPVVKAHVTVHFPVMVALQRAVFQPVTIVRLAFSRSLEHVLAQVSFLC